MQYTKKKDQSLCYRTRNFEDNHLVGSDASISRQSSFILAHFCQIEPMFSKLSQLLHRNAPANRMKGKNVSS